MNVYDHQVSIQSSPNRPFHVLHYLEMQSFYTSGSLWKVARSRRYGEISSSLVMMGCFGADKAGNPRGGSSAALKSSSPMRSWKFLL